MSSLFRRRHSSVQCWFCNTALPIPQNPRNFRCSACNCWNRYNDRGEILSDEPAMHEESLNRKSFSKRASPSKDQLPNIVRPGPFCHDCQTNQNLIMNLLSNYLPAPEHPEYQERLRRVPEYKESVYARYPPVCEACQPAVEDEIHQKEQMARRKALGGWLKEGRERKRRTSGVPKPKEIVIETLAWKIRGALWVSCSVASITLMAAAIIGRRPLNFIPYSTSTLPFLVLGSLLWTMWDPTYVTIKRAYIQGRDVRVYGRTNYILFQLATWISRLLISLVLAFHNKSSLLTRYVASCPRIYLSLALVIELCSLLAYPLCIRIQHPPPIRLIDTQSHRNTLSRSATPASSSHSSIPTPTASTFPKVLEPDLLASLTLSNKPVVTPPKPVFGLPSLASISSRGSSFSNALSAEPTRNNDEDAMDWSPTNEESSSYLGAQKRRQQQQENDGFWLRPQRFFAPEKPTGLENLFERTKLVDDDAMRVDGEEQPSSTAYKAWRSWRIWLPMLVVACSLPLIFFTRPAWSTRIWSTPARFVTESEL
ncbi:Ima1 N-terminal domain-containing protein [Ephemerocybe angulata]|uniref:Ima1 N-terminal domain-containing protein n=1 Tax=Ephemerocybe angulata TaxID=980116 RepID=A0A8H6MH09_9AGAR|nr:Ima1 N-terminal domain-containing protein [Tulosesus angulatus]